ncbi:2OG-Fe(II) oxygenase [Octadecabacter sp.]|nr:2OG-Fe(II) oxygenase [Octadecabacter sp.]MDC1380025.1 2OG-Fe(II) oxygenase [Octadecabacter sp.]MDC1500677.1 2OG-Fe(II) oxygenase [Octadecabacter sp.]
MMSLHSLPNAFSGAECERIIASIASSPKDEALLVGKNRDHNKRRAELVWIDNVDGMSWVMERLIDLVRNSNRDQFDFDLRNFAESPQVATYKAASGGHFAWHSDIGDGLLARQRKLTLVLQLSTSQSYEGGDFQVMPSANVLTANRGQGCVSIFPSFSLHQVTPVTNGIRHSLTVWAHGPSFR